MQIIKTLAIVSLIAAPTIALAQGNSGGASQNTPGHKMQDKGSKTGSPGASGYAPGHQMQDKGSKAGSPGASGYAPGHNK
jgi:hypothetical protein